MSKKKGICMGCGKTFEITRYKEIMAYLLPPLEGELFLEWCSLECEAFEDEAYELPVTDDLLGEPDKIKEEVKKELQ